jgi:hypothetical protein
MKKLELILIAGAVTGLLLALFNVPNYTIILSVFFLVLSLLYFYLGFAILTAFIYGKYSQLNPIRDSVRGESGLPSAPVLPFLRLPLELCPPFLTTRWQKP